MRGGGIPAPRQLSVKLVNAVRWKRGELSIFSDFLSGIGQVLKFVFFCLQLND